MGASFHPFPLHDDADEYTASFLLCSHVVDRYCVGRPSHSRRRFERYNPDARSENTPHSADGLVYLSHMHCTNSMRARRWIWALAERLKDAKRALYKKLSGEPLS
ncbi:hypothetical protein BDZ89DRAFT_1071396 [Hymenopellis radicata]|nr:hypothetical protein BDZ89DRAFT_1071396 [Hymenopellis radicata]